MKRSDLTPAADQYFKIRPERQDYHGERYFKLSYDTRTCVQVCKGVGDSIKKGKANNIGVYMIHPLTLFSNYLALNYAIPAKKTEYEKAFNEVIKYLK